MRTLLQNMSEKIKLFERQLLKQIILIFSTSTRSSTHCILQADKSLEPLPIILSKKSHLHVGLKSLAVIYLLRYCICKIAMSISNFSKGNN